MASFTITNPRGNSYDGSGEGQVNGNRLKLNVTMDNTGTEYAFDLERVGSILTGNRSRPGKSWDHIFEKE